MAVKNIQWAEDVMHVFRNIHADALDPTTSSPEQIILHQWANDSEVGANGRVKYPNRTEFLKNMVPKAGELIARVAEKQDSDSVRKSEMRAIGDLQNELIRAVEASNGIEPQLRGSLPAAEHSEGQLGQERLDPEPMGTNSGPTTTLPPANPFA